MILLALLNSLLPAMGIAVAVWAALRIARVNAATRYWVWWAALAAIVVLMFWPSAPQTRGPAPVEVHAGVNWFAWAALAWLAFAAYRLMRLAASYIRVRILCNRAQQADESRLTTLAHACGIKRKARLLTSGQISSPIAVGFLPPDVILPETTWADLTPAELDDVLLHELAHIARRDDWMNLIARFAGAFLGFHPVVAFVLARIERERELACDDWVVTATGRAQSYAASLAKVFELSRGGRPMLASGITGSHLGDRIEQLLGQGRRFTRDASIAAVILMAAVLGVMVAVAVQSPDWVAFAQERETPRVAPPVPPEPSAAPVPPVPPVAPAPSVPPVAPVAPVAPNVPLTLNLRDHEAQRQALLRAFEFHMRARQAQMEAEQDRLITTEESLRARQAALKAELEALQAQLEQLLRQK